MLDETLAAAPEPRLFAEIQQLRGEAAIRAGDLMKGHDFLVQGAARIAETGGSLIDRAVESARAQGAFGALPYALVLAARAAATGDRWAVGEALYEEAIRLARETEQAVPLCAGLAGVASVEARQGNADASRRHAEEALALCDRHGLGFHRWWTLDALAELELGLGRFERRPNGSSRSSAQSMSSRSPILTSRCSPSSSRPAFAAVRPGPLREALAVFDRLGSGAVGRTSAFGAAGHGRAVPRARRS
jgi:hypothetical protein